MTVSSQTLAFEYAANGVTTTFPYGFRVLDAAQVKVYVNDVIQVGGYSLTGVGDAGGGNVVFSVAPVNGATVLVRRISDRVRTTDFQQAPYFTQEELLDRDQDYQTMLLQEASADAANALRIPAVETNVVLLPDAATRANKFLQFNGNGDVGLSDGSGNNPTTYFATTKAAGDTLAASLSNGATVFVTADESLGGVRVRYTVASGALTGGVPDTAAMVQANGGVTVQEKLTELTVGLFLASSSNTTFNADGSITQAIDGVSVETEFNADGSITTTYGAPISKTVTTTFTNNTISEVAA